MSSKSTMNPSGGADSRHVMERYPLNSVTVAQVLERENLQKAWKQVKANKGLRYRQYFDRGVSRVRLQALGGNQGSSSGRDIRTFAGEESRDSERQRGNPSTGHPHGYGSPHSTGYLSGADPNLRSPFFKRQLRVQTQPFRPPGSEQGGERHG